MAVVAVVEAMDDIENSRSTISQLGLSVTATAASQVGGL
jgi:hypothetical protein